AALNLVVVMVGWQRQLRLTRVALVVVATALAAVTIASDLVVAGAWRTHQAWAGRAGPLFPVHLLLIAASTIPSLTILVQHVRAATGAARRRYAYALLALGIGCMALFDFLPFFSIDATPSSYLSIVFAALVLFYAVRDEPLADLTTLIMRALAWAALSALVLLPIFALAFITRSWPGWQQPWLAALLVYGLFLALWFYLVRVQPHIDHLFARRAHDLDAAGARFGERVAVLSTVSQLGQAVAHTLEQTLYVRVGAVAYAPAQPGEPWVVAHSAWGRVPPPA